MRINALKFLPAVAVLLVCTGCGSGASRSGGSGSGATEGLRVSSSITNGAVLSTAVPWTATPSGVSRSNVDLVQFTIDGRVRWTEQNPPFTFNGDGNDLLPWVLGPGQHTLSVKVVTVSGASASTSSAITVAAPQPIPAALTGSYARHVTAADVRRTQSFRNEPLDQVLPAGAWRIRIAPTGVISFIDPNGGAGNETFTATPGGTLALHGPANWIVPPAQQGAFCEVEPIGSYGWSAHGRALVLKAVSDRCADRNSLFAGTWRRS